MRTFDLVGKRKFGYTLSTVLILGAIISLLTVGLNLGIDFTGGTILERGFEQPVTAREVRELLSGGEIGVADLEKSVVQPLGNGKQVLIRTRTLTNDEIGKVDAALEAKFGSMDALRTDMVGPVIGSELVRNALWALGLASILIVIYVAFRFQALYGFVAGLAAIIAVAHDALFTVGVLSILGKEINSPFVAAILTVVGYSINDTIVIFDRIRENVRYGHSKETLAETINRAIFETLPRTINTSFTTLLVIIALLVFGGASIKDFVLTLFIGVIVGTYSTVFIASPILVTWRNWQEKRAVAR